MCELDDILAFHQRNPHSKAALATVIYTEGPSYRSPGARSIITDEGVFRGGVSAGCLEGDLGCRLDGELTPFVVEYDLSAEDEIRGFPFGCGGKLGIFVEPLPNTRALNAVQILAALAQPAIVMTVIKVSNSNETGDTRDNRAMIGMRSICSVSDSSDVIDINWDGEVHQAKTLEQLALAFACQTKLTKIRTEAIANKSAKVEELQIGPFDLQIFVEYFEPAISLRIFGDSEDALTLFSMAENLGLKVRRVSRRDVRSSAFEGLAFEDKSSARTYNVVMTHDLILDAKIVACLLPSDSIYLGILGPRSRTARILDSLNVDSQATFESETFYSPVGLDIGAETPQEIALSILSEIQMVAKGRKPQHLKNVDGPIHKRQSTRPVKV
ncbi:MAG: XdhC family protein [Candidatus Obscuribacterales bacterium]|jgi:xanthine/CO dehydrogenase XdhC/CoxF family maturation factor